MKNPVLLRILWVMDSCINNFFKYHCYAEFKQKKVPIKLLSALFKFSYTVFQPKSS
jgi:hypothetical protein